MRRQWNRGENLSVLLALFVSALCLASALFVRRPKADAPAYGERETE